MSIYVVDASVGAKWLLPEVGTPEAMRLRRHPSSRPSMSRRPSTAYRNAASQNLQAWREEEAKRGHRES
jgi:hypothetical protein